MLRYFRSTAGALEFVEHPDELPRDDSLLWVDLQDPSEQEKELVAQRFGLDVPTPEEMAEIEPSSRLYLEDGALFMTATLVAHLESGAPRTAPVTFILTPRRLITLRYIDPKSFRSFIIQLRRNSGPAQQPHYLLAALLESVIYRFADVLERVSLELEATSAEVFPHGAGGEPRPLGALLQDIGRSGDLVSKVRESLTSIVRLLTYFGHPTNGYADDAPLREHIKSLGRDIASLSDHATFQATKVNFLLDATLGRISIEQNNIIKIFSVAAVVFLPPTLVASIYGMNFANMPEVNWRYGYPLALVVMLASAVLPYLFFKRKGWL